jgi:hypothetical protein
MGNVNSKDAIIKYALRNLGYPVIEINVDYEQCLDRVDDALELFAERHFDGVEKVYFKHQVTSDTIVNKVIHTDTLLNPSGVTGDGPDGTTIVSVIKLFRFGGFANIGMFDVRYQMALTDYFGINRGLGSQSGMGLATYDSTKRYINMIEQFFAPEKAIRFNKVSNKIYIDGIMSDTAAGDYLIIEAYAALNPEVYTEIYDDRLMKKYVTALIKKQWGSNMSKFDGVQLPGGITTKGAQIYGEAVQEIQAIEQELISTMELPSDFFIG